MSKISIEKRLPRYHKIYKQIYEHPSIPSYQAAKNIGMARSTVSRYLIEMYDFSIIQGPFIFVRPAQNCHQYASFLNFKYPLDVYKSFKGFPHVVCRNLVAGPWNLLLICEKSMDLSSLKGFRHCVCHDVKSVTRLSKVVSLDWDQSMEKMYKAISPPRKKSTLYEEIPFLPWGEQEWTLYNRFKHNTRNRATSILKECGIRYGRYQKWVSELPKYTHIHPVFFPKRPQNYFIFDFLFKSEYHEQLSDILGMLPSTCVFFSVGEYLMARIALLDKKEKDDLFTFIFQLEENEYFTTFSQVVVISSSSENTG
jgi:hypothetical protein